MLKVWEWYILTVNVGSKSVITKGHYVGDRFIDENYNDIDNVLAWRELPEIYNEN